mmetsp:Transcript_17236/g.60569  ORF Transcript_17236/g.60569 Transcript_17236/m.60569 type:complete len:500 (+) Transcript_17236:671-2170(+)
MSSLWLWSDAAPTRPYSPCGFDTPARPRNAPQKPRRADDPGAPPDATLAAASASAARRCIWGTESRMSAAAPSSLAPPERTRAACFVTAAADSAALPSSMPNGKIDAKKGADEDGPSSGCAIGTVAAASSPDDATTTPTPAPRHVVGNASTATSHAACAPAAAAARATASSVRSMPRPKQVSSAKDAALAMANDSTCSLPSLTPREKANSRAATETSSAAASPALSPTTLDVSSLQPSHSASTLASAAAAAAAAALAAASASLGGAMRPHATSTRPGVNTCAAAMTWIWYPAATNAHSSARRTVTPRTRGATAPSSAVGGAGGSRLRLRVPPAAPPAAPTEPARALDGVPRSMDARAAAADAPTCSCRGTPSGRASSAKDGTTTPSRAAESRSACTAVTVSPIAAQKRAERGTAAIPTSASRAGSAVSADSVRQACASTGSSSHASTASASVPVAYHAAARGSKLRRPSRVVVSRASVSAMCAPPAPKPARNTQSRKGR